MYPVDVGDALAQIEFSIFGTVTAFDFDERCIRFRVALSAGEGDVLSSHIESVRAISIRLRCNVSVYRCCPSGIVVDGEGGETVSFVVIRFCWAVAVTKTVPRSFLGFDSPRFRHVTKGLRR